MELFIFARFHARPGFDAKLEGTLRRVIGPTRDEAGCLSIQLFRSTRDPQLFYIHSRWLDEAAFDLHATLLHTVEFVARAEPLIDHTLDVTRAELID
jgi:quinol monooxygenase YgiN